MGRKGWGGQGRGRGKSTDSQSSHGQEGRSLKGKQAPSQQGCCHSPLPTPPTQCLGFCAMQRARGKVTEIKERHGGENI